jgi:hypothetical protein
MQIFKKNSSELDFLKIEKNIENEILNDQDSSFNNSIDGSSDNYLINIENNNNI